MILVPVNAVYSTQRAAGVGCTRAAERWVGEKGTREDSNLAERRLDARVGGEVVGVVKRP